MSVGLVSYLLDEVAYTSLTIMKSSTIYLGFEVISRIAEGCMYRSAGVLLRPGSAGLGRLVFKLVRPFSGIDSNNRYKLSTGRLVLSSLAAGTITHLANQFITPRHLSCICPI